MLNKNKTPIFVVFEGIDGCGKSTLCGLMTKIFLERKIDVWHTREPWLEDDSGKALQSYLQQQPSETLENEKKAGGERLEKLFIQNRMKHSNAIEQRMLQNTNVFCERYDVSTYAYQTLGMNVAEQNETFQKIFEGHCYGENPGCSEPMLTFYCEVLPETAMQRIEKRLTLGGKKERFEKLSTLQQVANNYEATFNYIKKRSSREIVFLNANASAQKMLEEALYFLKHKLGLVVLGA